MAAIDLTDNTRTNRGQVPKALQISLEHNKETVKRCKHCALELSNDFPNAREVYPWLGDEQRSTVAVFNVFLIGVYSQNKRKITPC